MRRLVIGVFIIAFTVGAGTTPFAGEIFRLEIGRPIAGGSQTKNKAVLVARPLCCDPATVRITATAEGIVNGRRESIPLEVGTLDTPGVHAIARQWPDGQWVLNLTGHCAERGTTTSAVVPLGPAGFIREQIQILDRAATAADVDAALRVAREIRTSPSRS